MFIHADSCRSFESSSALQHHNFFAWRVVSSWELITFDFDFTISLLSKAAEQASTSLERLCFFVSVQPSMLGWPEFVASVANGCQVRLVEVPLESTSGSVLHLESYAS